MQFQFVFQKMETKQPGKKSTFFFLRNKMFYKQKKYTKTNPILKRIENIEVLCKWSFLTHEKSF